MKYALPFLMFFAVNLNAQVLDFEVIDECLQDSGTKFKRVRVLNTGEIKDYTFDLTAEYTVRGTVTPCDDLELLEPECYETIGGDFCDYSLDFPASASTGLTRRVDSIFSNNTYLTLNYPYVFQNNGVSDVSEYNRFSIDLTAYLDARNIEYNSVGPGMTVTQTNYPLTRSSQTTITNSNATYSSRGNSVINCVSEEAKKIKLYRNQDGEVQVIIDNEGNILNSLPSQRISAVDCDVELLEKECYQSDSVSYCTTCVTGYGTSNPDDIEVNGYIDSIFDYQGNFMTLPNYPYYYRRNNGTSASDRVQLQLDLSAYYTAQGWSHTPYSASSPNMCVRETDKYISRNTTVLERQNPTSTIFNSHNNTPFLCETQIGGEFEVYRDQSGAISLIIDAQGNVINTLPTTSVKVDCSVELLDTECYEVPTSSTELCNSSVLVPGFATNPFDPNTSAEIDSVYIDNQFVTLPNYPYQFVVAAGNSDDTPQLMIDIEAYLISNNIQYDMISGTSILQSTSVVTRTSYVLYRQSGNISSGQNSVGFGCVTDVSSEVYRLYRTVAGSIHIVVDDKGNVLSELPVGAVKVECCLVCDMVKEDMCQVKNKSLHDLISGTVKTYDADTYAGISVMGHSGVWSYSFDDANPIIIDNESHDDHYGFSLPNQKNCEYQKSKITIDATQGTVTVIVQY